MAKKSHRKPQQEPKRKPEVMNAKAAYAGGVARSVFGSAAMASPFANGLQEAILGSPILGFNPGVAPGIGTPVTQVNTLQLNLRWYFVSNFRQLLSQAYCEKGLIKTVCDVPVRDALRGGVDVKTKQLNGHEIERLQMEMKRAGDLHKVGQANIWKRLFGGAGLVVITNQDPREPFKIDSIKKGDPLNFRAVDMWELFWSKQNTEDYSLAIDTEVENPLDPNVEFYEYYDQSVHYTRVLKLVGMEAPSFLRPRLRGWGLSIVETIVDALNQYLKSISLVFEVLDEFKVDVYKIRNFASDLLSPDGTNQVRQRLMLANQQKNFFNALTMDAEDDFIQKELSFAGLAETMVGIRMQIASELRMPVSKLFGTGSTGFSSGEDDIENYNGMVESDVRTDMEREVLFVTRCRCQQMFGFEPDDLSIAFKPLRVLSTVDEENVKTQRFTRLKSTVDSGLCSVMEFKEGVNADNLLSVQLDTSLDQMMPMQMEEGGQMSSEDEELPKPIPKLPKPIPAKGNRTPEEPK